MKKIIFITSFIYTLMIGTTVAEDIEIYVGTNEDNTTQANVLLMVDTSGSMGSYITGTNETRISQTKTALKEILTKLPSNTRVGLGRYNDPGGSILYPVQTLSTNIKTKIVKSITSNSNDAFQDYSGAVTVNNDHLKFINGLKNVSSSISRSSDDARQCIAGGLFSINTSYLELNADNNCSSYLIGMIFRNLNIPKNAKIVSSNIDFRLGSMSYGDVDTEIVTENSVNPETYSNESSKRLIDRNYITNPSINWTINSGWLFTSITTPDISSIIQNMVNRNDWTNSSYLNIMMKKPSGGRNGSKVSLYSYDIAGASWSPNINVSYYDTTTGKTLVGLKFDDIQIPSGAHITKATLKLKASANNGNGSIRTRIETSNTVPSYTATNNNISSRTLMGSSINSNYSNWNLDSHAELDITSIVQDKVNGNWCGGDNMGFVLDSFDAFQAYSFDSGSINSPSLEIEFDTVPAVSCTRNNLVYQIRQNSDDGGERNDGNMYINQQLVELSSRYPYGAIRFQNVDMDTKNITNLEIEDAYIEFTSASVTSGSSLIKITGEKTGNSSILGSNQNHISTKSKTSASVDWPMNEIHYTNTVYRTTNIAPIITEIMNQSSWKAGNSLTLLLQRTSGTRSFMAYDYSISKSAKLIIKYKGNGAYKGVTVREHLTNLIDSLPAEGYTPLEGALYESAQYFLGRNVDFGRSRNTSSGTSGARSKRISDDNTYTGGKHIYPSGCTEANLSSSECTGEYISGNPIYNSPMTGSTCEVNSLIMITDGYPSGMYNRPNMDGTALNTQIRRLTNSSCNDSWSCAGVVAKYIYDTDFDINVGGKQNVYTHVIGFDDEAIDSDGRLTDLARKGGGMFIHANNNQDLVGALTKIFNNILDINTTLASPGIAVNQNNRMEHLNDIYYSVFKPSVRKSWYGNLKKYKIDSRTAQIVDANGVEAIDPNTGFFKANTQSYWSTSVDGLEASAGGAASKLTLPRKVYTYTGTTSPKNILLTNPENIFSETNTSLTRSLFELDNSISNTDFSNFLKWGRGVDIHDEDQDGSMSDVKGFLADPLHSRPILLNYSENKNIVYFSTNNGYLHAVDAESGNEVFSFIPKEMLPNLYTHYLDEPGKKLYGLDSSWVALRHDHNQDGNINSSGDYIYLYGGMRMGGRNYYSLDVTDTSAPKLKWVITPSSNTAFQNIGQTWSEPVVTKIKINGVEKIVLVFAGGYDPSYESSTYDSASDSIGNQLYIVDAETGALIWWASKTGTAADTKINGMNYSIPAKPTVIDLDNDTLADIIYVGDLGGQVFKFKINNENKGKSDLITGKIIAKLGISDTTLTGVTNRRKIFEPITATRVKRNNEKYMALVLGSGSRSRPLNKQINDSIFVIKDKEDFYSTTSTTLDVIKMSDLYDVTNVFNKDTLLKQTTDSKGFKIMLKEGDGTYRGEKVLSEQVVYDNKILFSTYVPDGYATRCYPVEGFSRSYQISIFDGSPANSDNIENADNLKNSDRYSKNVLPGIAAGSKIIYTDNKVIELVNTQAKELGKGGELGLKRLKWYKETTDE